MPARARTPKRVNAGSWEELRMWAEAFDSAQRQRMAFKNKERAGTVDMEPFGPVTDLYVEAENRLGRELLGCYRVTVPDGIKAWQQATPGIGEHTLARLLGITGDPLMAYPSHWDGTGPGRILVADPPHARMISELWQYCGVGAQRNRKVKGDAAALMANGSPDAKKLLWLMAVSQVKTTAKAGSAYRGLYDETKQRYALKTHSGPCPGGWSGTQFVKCKVTLDGQPVKRERVAGADSDAAPVRVTAGQNIRYADMGDPFQKSHLHAIALRHVAKRIVRDLWLAAGGPHPDLLNDPRYTRHGVAGRREFNKWLREQMKAQGLA